MNAKTQIMRRHMIASEVPPYSPPTRFSEPRHPAVEFIGVHKWYGDYHALRDINLVVRLRSARCHLWSFRLGEVDTYPLR